MGDARGGRGPDGPTPAYRELRRHRRATLRVDDRPVDIRYVLDPATGRPALPLARELAGGAQYVLFVPDDRFGALEVLCEPDLDAAERDESAVELARDRYLAYFRRVDPGRFVLFEPVSAKLEADVWDGGACVGPNPLASAEPGLCKSLNADRRALSSVCASMIGMSIDEPLCVGVDELGADVRTAVEVVRLEWPRPVADAEAARVMIDGLLRASSGDLALGEPPDAGPE